MRKALTLVAGLTLALFALTTSPAAQEVAAPAPITAFEPVVLSAPIAAIPPPQIELFENSGRASGAQPSTVQMMQGEGSPPSPAASVPTKAQGAVSPMNIKVDAAETAGVVRLAVVLTLATLLPMIALCMTPFLRIVVVLSMIRHAFGMPETPPNQVLISLALFLTIFVMGPTITQVNGGALQPFLAGSLTVEQALDRGAAPARAFMLRQVHDQDIAAVYAIAKKPLPERASDVGLMELTSAFMLNELRVSFKMGFVVLLPFLLIDLVVSGILLSLGMLMVPPTTLSLPIKVMMFVLIDGWTLVLQGVVGSFR